MAKRIGTTTKEHLISAPLPTYEGDSYTVIPHEFVIKEALTSLGSQGFEIKNETYRCNHNADIAQGIYYLNYADDEEMGMMFAWSNSYNKTMKFKCAIGGYVFICSNGMVRGDMGSWGRKHTGSADQETIDTIHSQIINAKSYYTQLVHDKENMKQIILSDKATAELVGRLFVEQELLNTEQLSIIKQEIKNPSYQYSGDKNSLWHLYNHVTHSIKKSHPKDWLDHQRLTHWFFTQEFGMKPLDIVENTANKVTDEKPVSETIQNPNQIDLLDAIAQAEGENTLNL